MTSLPFAAFAPVLFGLLHAAVLAAAIRSTKTAPRTSRRPATAPPHPDSEPLRPAA
jgi:hypothetical protein